ncbi:MAG: cupin domain-containing protein [Haloarculaceae archaeon]
MEKVTVEDVTNEPRVAAVTKHLTDPLGLSDAAINYFELEPGDSFSGGLHTHTDQEEIFYVIEGEATFETLDDAFTIGADEAVRFAGGEYQEGRNESDDRVVALAIGAPQEMGETRAPLPCSACGDSDYHVAEVEPDGVTLVCPECGNEVEG